MPAGPVDRTDAPFARPADLTKDDRTTPRRGPRRSRDSRMLPVCDDDSDVSRRNSPAARARAPGHRRHVPAAVNLVVVESDGSRPDRPDYLGGGGQARRHRAACNRGHGLLRCCVEFEVPPAAREATSPSIIARHRRPRKSGRLHICSVRRSPASARKWSAFRTRRNLLPRARPRLETGTRRRLSS